MKNVLAVWSGAATQNLACGRVSKSLCRYHLCPPSMPFVIILIVVIVCCSSSPEGMILYTTGIIIYPYLLLLLLSFVLLHNIILLLTPPPPPPAVVSSPLKTERPFHSILSRQAERYARRHTGRFFALGTSNGCRFWWYRWSFAGFRNRRATTLRRKKQGVTSLGQQLQLLLAQLWKKSCNMNSPKPVEEKESLHDAKNAVGSKYIIFGAAGGGR